eukprot:2766975-Pleurochrysis_carterae.AAC.1
MHASMPACLHTRLNACMPAYTPARLHACVYDSMRRTTRARTWLCKCQHAHAHMLEVHESAQARMHAWHPDATAVTTQ